MEYREWRPCEGLAPYIDAYWTLKGASPARAAEKLMPDGCMDIILNRGEDLHTSDSNLWMKNERTYLVGTMTRFKEITRSGFTDTIGIRFKPAAFPFFYRFSSLHEIADTTIELERSALPELRGNALNWVGRLDLFFGERLSLSHARLLVFEAIADIRNLKGQVKAEELARRHFLSSRQLERYFKSCLGTSPKEYISFSRYQAALAMIRSGEKQSLSHIAWDAGYYDHAHLTNEIRKYSGSVPSEL